jgi:hypothetical protein
VRRYRAIPGRHSQQYSSSPAKNLSVCCDRRHCGRRRERSFLCESRAQRAGWTEAWGTICISKKVVRNMLFPGKPRLSSTMQGHTNALASGTCYWPSYCYCFLRPQQGLKALVFRGVPAAILGLGKLYQRTSLRPSIGRSAIPSAGLTAHRKATY